MNSNHFILSDILIPMDLLSYLHGQYPDRELLSKISQLEAKIEQVEEENREVKENLEFVTIETNVLQESLKEVEDQLAKERERKGG